MSASRKLRRAQQAEFDSAQDKRAAASAVVAHAVFPESPADPKFIPERIAICLNLVLLCESKGVEVGKMLDVIKSAAVDYDEERDGKSALMRWWGDVKAQKVREASVIGVSMKGKLDAAQN